MSPCTTKTVPGEQQQTLPETGRYGCHFRQATDTSRTLYINLKYSVLKIWRHMPYIYICIQPRVLHIADRLGRPFLTGKGHTFDLDTFDSVAITAFRSVLQTGGSEYSECDLTWHWKVKNMTLINHSTAPWRKQVCMLDNQHNRESQKNSKHVPSYFDTYCVSASS